MNENKQRSTSKMLSNEEILEIVKEVYGWESQMYADELIVEPHIFDEYEGPHIDLLDAR